MNIPFSNVVLYPTNSQIEHKCGVEHKCGNVYRVWHKDCASCKTIVVLACVDFGRRQLISLQEYANRWSSPVKCTGYLGDSIPDDVFERLSPVPIEWEYVCTIDELITKAGLV